jgi:flagellar basal body P-ring formation protein FlgA
MLFKTIKHLVMTALIIISSYSHAGYYEPVSHLTALAKDFVIKTTPVATDETINVRPGTELVIPPVRACQQPINAELPANSNQDQVTAVELSCNDQPSWHVLVPVNVQILTKVIVAKQPILPKQEITDDLLDYATYDKNVLFNSYYKNKDEIIGQVASHMITAGTILTRKNLQAPVLVHKNDVVTIVAISHSVTVSMQGIAKSDGCLHESIKIYNPSSKRMVDAVVAGPNRAESIA